MQTFMSIILLLTFYNKFPTKPLETDHLFKRWVVNAPSNPGSFSDLKEIEFILSNSEDAEKLPMHLKYGGISFQKDGVFIEHWWNQCGTGNPPSSKSSEWSISDNGIEKLITISGSNNWNGIYLIDKLDSETLHLIRKN